MSKIHVKVEEFVLGRSEASIPVVRTVPKSRTCTFGPCRLAELPAIDLNGPSLSAVRGESDCRVDCFPFLTFCVSVIARDETDKAKVFDAEWGFLTQRTREGSEAVCGALSAV